MCLTSTKIAIKIASDIYIFERMLRIAYCLSQLGVVHKRRFKVVDLIQMYDALTSSLPIRTP